jgi:hypothetical protein
VFSDDALRQAAAFSYARQIRTRRGAQDLVYRMFAVAAIELFQEAYPERRPPSIGSLRPRRHSLLSELGRVAQPRSDEKAGCCGERDVSRLVSVALEIAESRPSTKVGVERIRDARRRFRETTRE